MENKLLPGYADRYYCMMKAIGDYLLPLGLTMPQPNKDVAGGYFIWLTLPKPLLGEEIEKRTVEDEQLTILAGPKFRVLGDEGNEATRFDQDIRLCYAWEKVELLEEGVIRLARVIKNALDEQ